MKLKRCPTYDAALEQLANAAEQLRATTAPDDLERAARAATTRIRSAVQAHQARHDAKRRQEQLAEQTNDLLSDIRAAMTDRQRWTHMLTTFQTKGRLPGFQGR